MKFYQSSRIIFNDGTLTNVSQRAHLLVGTQSKNGLETLISRSFFNLDKGYVKVIYIGDVDSAPSIREMPQEHFDIVKSDFLPDVLKHLKEKHYSTLASYEIEKWFTSKGEPQPLTLLVINYDDYIDSPTVFNSENILTVKENIQFFINNIESTGISVIIVSESDRFIPPERTLINQIDCHYANVLIPSKLHLVRDESLPFVIKPLIKTVSEQETWMSNVNPLLVQGSVDTIQNELHDIFQENKPGEEVSFRFTNKIEDVIYEVERRVKLTEERKLAWIPVNWEDTNFHHLFYIIPEEQALSLNEEEKERFDKAVSLSAHVNIYITTRLGENTNA